MEPIEEDVALGNRNNTTSSEALIDRFYEAFTSEGFNTVKNRVFIGGYITKSYAIKDMVETLQIELRYTNYIEPHELDKRQTPTIGTTLFYETVFRLERVFKKAGIYKIEDEKIKKETQNSNRGLKIWLLVLFFVLSVGLSLIEK